MQKSSSKSQLPTTSKSQAPLTLKQRDDERIEKMKTMLFTMKIAASNIKKLNPAKTEQVETIESSIDSLVKELESKNIDKENIIKRIEEIQTQIKSLTSTSASSGSVGPGDVANTSTPSQPVAASASAPPSVGTDSDTIKVEFQALYDNAYTEIKQCFCQGMANLFYEAFLPSTEHVYEALNKALYVDVVDKHNGGIASQVNPDYEMIVGDQVEKIMKFIMTNPDPQIRIDIRKNLSGGCNISQEHHQASITRGKPTAIVGGNSTYKHQTKHQKIYTQKKPHKKSM